MVVIDGAQLSRECSVIALKLLDVILVPSGLNEVCVAVAASKSLLRYPAFADTSIPSTSVPFRSTSVPSVHISITKIGFSFFVDGLTPKFASGITFRVVHLKQRMVETGRVNQLLMQETRSEASVSILLRKLS